MWHLWGLAVPPHPVQLGSGMGPWVRGGECLAPQGLPSSHQESGLYPAALGRLSGEKGVGLRRDPCGRASRMQEGLGGLLDTPWMTGDPGGGLSRTH